MNKRRFALLLLFPFYSITSVCQDTIYFKKGLMVDAPGQYGREAITTDLLAYKLYINALQKPAEGETFGEDEDGEKLTWQSVVADSLNRLRPATRPERGNRRRFRGNYTYLTYSSDKDQAALLNIKGNSFLFSMGNFIRVILMVQAGCTFLFN
ncbi:MAG: hypothetical protein M3015_17305 [Bacteroidota bacterium]|nr:hypothetical protein [Bacteroidota bacterium]